MCIGGFRVHPRGVLPLGKEGAGSTGSEGGAGAVRRIIIESAAEF